MRDLWGMVAPVGGRLFQARIGDAGNVVAPLYSLLVDNKTNIPMWGYKLLLLSAAAIWGGSFVVLKNSLDTVAPSWLLVMRFGLASIVLVAALFPRLREHFDAGYLLPGLALGLSYGLGYVLQTYGLDFTTPGRNAFLTAPYCVIVPYMVWVAGGKRPTAFNIVAALLAIAGIGFISLGDDLSLSLGLGDWLTLGCSVMYALHMVLIPITAKKRDILTLTVVQMAVCFLVSLVCAVAFDEPPTADVFTPGFCGALAYLVLLASCYTMVAQNVGQAKVEPASGALILSLESVFAVICSIIFYGEEITPQLAIGFTLIFVAIVVSEVVAPLKGKRDSEAVKA